VGRRNTEYRHNAKPRTLCAIVIDLNDMKLIKTFLSNRANVFEIFLIAILTTLGINLITTGIYPLIHNSNKDTYFLFIGIGLVCIAIVYLATKLLLQTKILKSYEGFILVDNKSKLPVDCDGYEYLEELNRNFVAAFSENKALEHIWKTKSVKRVEKDSLIKEATEYYLIDELSTHLTDYFNLRGLDKKQLIEFSRNDIPDILLTNRFLELFSKPMEQRASFIKDLKNDKSPGKVVMSMGDDGTLFKEFDFVLPKGSKVTRSEGAIIIDTKRFKISLKVNYGGFGNVLPRGFETYYLGYTSYRDTWTTKIEVDITVEFKYFTVISKGGWDYYEWIELFLDKFEENFSEEYFFNKIKWDQVYVQTKIFEKMITAHNNGIANSGAGH